MTTRTRTAIAAAALAVAVTGMTACTTTPAPAPNPSAVAWPTTCPEVRHGGQIQIVAPVSPMGTQEALPLLGSGDEMRNRALAGKYQRLGCQVVQVDRLVWQQDGTPRWSRTLASSRLALPAGMAVPEGGKNLCADVTFTPWRDNSRIATYEPHSGSQPDVPADCAEWPR